MWNKVLTAVLGLLILSGIVVLVYSIAVPFEEPFTEFYLLDTGGETVHYPSELKVGEEASVLVGIVNHEYQTSTYQLNVRLDGDIETNPVELTLEHGGKWEEPVAFSLNRAGDGQKVEFLLSNTDNGSITHHLYLLIDVKE